MYSSLVYLIQQGAVGGTSVLTTSQVPQFMDSDGNPVRMVQLEGMGESDYHVCVSDICWAIGGEESMLSNIDLLHFTTLRMCLLLGIRCLCSIGPELIHLNRVPKLGEQWKIIIEKYFGLIEHWPLYLITLNSRSCLP